MKPFVFFVVGIVAGAAVIYFVFYEPEVQQVSKLTKEKSRLSEDLEQTKDTLSKTRDRFQLELIRDREQLKADFQKERETWNAEQSKLLTKTPLPPRGIKPVKDLKGHKGPTPPPQLQSQYLEPPVFTAGVPDPILTNREGEAFVKWYRVRGAKRYALYIEDPEGNIVKTFNTSGDGLWLKDIPIPPDKMSAIFELRVASIGNNNIEGEKGAGRKLIVKAQAQLSAPEIKEIRVED